MQRTPEFLQRHLGSVAVPVTALLCLSCTVPLAPRGTPTGVGFAGTHNRSPTRFNQSCGAACSAPVSSTGEILVPAATRATQVLDKVVRAAEALHGILIVTKFLDETQKKKAEDILAECASVANFKVNEELFGEGKSLPESECDKEPNVKNKTADTWRQHLGNLKHAAAFICVQERLAAEFPNNFAVEPRYRRDAVTNELLLTDKWLGSQRPDVVLHFTRNATRIQCIYDFKFPCDIADRRNPLADPRTEAQLRRYKNLGHEDCLPSIVTPSLGVSRPPSL
jgi:hypothetical protein